MYELISNLPMLAEDIDREIFEAIPKMDYEYIEIDMTEARFLFGLVRHFKAKNILEIGVSSGGGSGLLLAAIEDIDGATLTSIDLANEAYRFPSKPVGFVAQKKHYNNPKWNLLTGKDPSEVIESIEKKFDFAFIDTAHVHPIETLNFLSVLPFLEDGAIVVLHDTSLYLCQRHYKNMNTFPNLGLATRYLLNSVCAEKIEPQKYEDNLCTQIANMAAFQVTQDTRKYIDGVLTSLLVPWSIIPTETILAKVKQLISKHYSAKQYKIFADAIRMNYYLQCKELKHVQDLFSILNKCKGKYILFGARSAKMYINMICGVGYEMPLEIWDNNVEYINTEDYCIDIIKPHFDVAEDIAVIFTVENEQTYINVMDSWPNEMRNRSFFFQKMRS